MAHILTVDDDNEIRGLIQSTLEMAGHKVASASDGGQAVAKISKTRFDVVILDIMMPNLNGYEVLEKIREMPSRAGMPVIVLTAKHDPEGVARALDAGAVDHLSKPFLPSELEGAVARALEGGDEAVAERRRALSHGADLTGSMLELTQSARDDLDKRR